MVRRGAALSVLAVAASCALLVLACETPTQEGRVTTPPTMETVSTETTALLGRHRCDAQGRCGSVEFEDYEFLSAVWLDESRMYLGTTGNSIELLDLTTGELRRVASDISDPKGLVVVGGKLFASNQGDSCAPWAELAVRLEAEGDTERNYMDRCRPWSKNAEVIGRIVLASDGHVTSFEIAPDGRLGSRTTEISGIPIGECGQGHNGLATDGAFIYGSVGYPGNGVKTGNPDNFVVDIEEELEPGRKRDLLGTVYRFHPDDPEGTLEVYARGFRNVYGLSVAGNGDVWAADNDGTPPGPHKEELNRITGQGHDYGFPYYGTHLAPPEAGITEPFALVPGKGSTAILASDDGVYHAYITDGPEPRFAVGFTSYDGQTHKRITDDNSYYVIALLELGGLLYIISHDGQVAAVDPVVAAEWTNKGGD